MFFIKQKTAYEMRISDWSSDVCSSDLHVLLELLAELGGDLRHVGHRFRIVAVDVEDRCLHHLGRVRRIRRRARVGRIGDRKSVVKGKSVSLRVGIGGRRNIQKNNPKAKNKNIRNGKAEQHSYSR